MTSSSVVVSRAVQFKDEGNAWFGRRQLSRAVQAYSCALRVLEYEQQKQQQQSEPKDLLLYAVITSNRSACYFELRQYHASAVDASECIDYLDDLLRNQQHKYERTLAHVPLLTPAQEHQALSMRDANQWRRTRALLYQHDGDLHRAQQQLDDLEKKKEQLQKNNGNDDNRFEMVVPELPLDTTTIKSSSSKTRVPLLPRRLTPRESL